MTDSAVPAAASGRGAVPEETPGPRSPAGKEETVKTVKSRGKGAKPSEAQRAFFARRLAEPCWTAAEVARWTAWGQTVASKKTMGEFCDWMAVERQRRSRASTTEEAA